MFLQRKRRDIHQCHSARLVPAAELLAVNNEIVPISFLFPSKQAGHHFLDPGLAHESVLLYLISGTAHVFRNCLALYLAGMLVEQ